MQPLVEEMETSLTNAGHPLSTIYIQVLNEPPALPNRELWGLGYMPS